MCGVIYCGTPLLPVEKIDSVESDQTVNHKRHSLMGYILSMYTTTYDLVSGF